MDNNKLLLSLCIPTNGIVEWVIPAVESIYAQGVDNSVFEVVVTDNGRGSDLEEAVKRFNYENFHFYKTTSLGFINQIDAFEKCSGVFCKMLNHRSNLLPGSITQLLNLVKKYLDTTPILYCAEGHAKGGDIIECSNTDEFVRRLTYWVSWSAGTGVWRKDIKDLRKKNIDNFFPHTVFLFGLREESEYVIWNGKYEIMASDAGKGGYDLFQAFGISFLDIINNLRVKNRISQYTFIEVKKDLLAFLKGLYLNEAILSTKHTFIIKDVRKSMSVYYSKLDFYVMLLSAWLKAPYNYLRSLVR